MTTQRDHSGYAPLPPPPASNRKWPVALLVLLGGGTVIGLGLVAIFAMALASGTHAAGKGDRIARQFMKYVEAKQDQKAYAMASRQWQANSSLSDFRSFANYWRQQQGDFKQIDRTGESWYSGTNGTRVTLTYTVAGSRRPMQVTVEVVTEGPRLAVQACNVSPAAKGGWHFVG